MTLNACWIYIYYIHRHMFGPSQDLSLWLGLTSREQLMSPECSKHQVLSFAKTLVVWWTNKKYSVLISVLQSAQWINSKRIYPCIIYIICIYYIYIGVCIDRLYILYIIYIICIYCIYIGVYIDRLSKQRILFRQGRHLFHVSYVLCHHFVFPDSFSVRTGDT